MKFEEVNILFEQSGTFKRVFEKHGYKVTEYDFVNCKPEFKLFPDTDRTQFRTNPIENHKGFSRSKISFNFAENFCNQFILE